MSDATYALEAHSLRHTPLSNSLLTLACLGPRGSSGGYPLGYKEANDPGSLRLQHVCLGEFYRVYRSILNADEEYKLPMV
jgi:hypothetical protein